MEITKFSGPYTFRDSMIEGAFKRFDHDHIFEQHDGLVKITDIFDYESPFSFFGKVFDFIILTRYMTNFSAHEMRRLKEQLKLINRETF